MIGFRHSLRLGLQDLIESYRGLAVQKRLIQIFDKVVKYILDGAFQFNVEREACKALKVADGLDMKELKEEVCKHIKDNLDLENVKAVASLAERFSAKQLFEAAF